MEERRSSELAHAIGAAFIAGAVIVIATATVTTIIATAAITAIIPYACYVWIRIIRNSRESRKNLLELDRDPSSMDEKPMVSIIVPVKNEEFFIGKCIKSLLKQDYKKFEIIIVDDESDDVTYEIAKSLEKWEESEDRISIKYVKKPKGWMGKAWASELGAYEAAGDVLLFTDADTEHKEDTLSRAMALMKSGEYRCLTLQKKIITKGYWLAAIFPVIMSFKYIYPSGMVLYSAKKIHDEKDLMGGLNGAYILIEKRAYDGVGGFAGVKESVLEDWSLGMKIKGKYKIGIADGKEHVSAMWVRYLSAFDHVVKRLFVPFGSNDEKAKKDSVRLFLFLFAPYPALLYSICATYVIYAPHAAAWILCAACISDGTYDPGGVACSLCATYGTHSAHSGLQQVQSWLAVAATVISLAGVLLHRKSYGIYAKELGVYGRWKATILAPIGGLLTSAMFIIAAWGSKDALWKDRRISSYEIEAGGQMEDIPDAAIHIPVPNDNKRIIVDISVILEIMESAEHGVPMEAKIADRYAGRLVTTGESMDQFKVLVGNDDLKVSRIKEWNIAEEADAIRPEILAKFNSMYNRTVDSPESQAAVRWMSAKRGLVANHFPKYTDAKVILEFLNKSTESSCNTIAAAASVALDMGGAYLITRDANILAFRSEIYDITEGNLEVRLPTTLM